MLSLFSFLYVIRISNWIFLSWLDNLGAHLLVLSSVCMQLKCPLIFRFIADDIP